MYYSEITSGRNSLFYVFISFFLSLPSMFRAYHQGNLKMFYYIQPFGSCSFYVVHMRVHVVWSVVVVSLYSWEFYFLPFSVHTQTDIIIAVVRGDKIFTWSV
jgi:hypothetical protein